MPDTGLQLSQEKVCDGEMRLQITQVAGGVGKLVMLRNTTRFEWALLCATFAVRDAHTSSRRGSVNEPRWPREVRCMFGAKKSAERAASAPCCKLRNGKCSACVCMYVQLIDNLRNA